MSKRETAGQKKAFDFFSEHLESKELFQRNDIIRATGWTESTLKTYWSKQFCPFLLEFHRGHYRVTEAFRPINSWEKFQKHITQVRGIKPSDYKPICFDLVRIYEFFMPLTNEAHLRMALDALFYRDTVEARIKTISDEDLKKCFPIIDTNETEAKYKDRLCGWISDHFGGYSVYHVSGRFRAQPLTARKKAAESSRYIVDETTAVARFIFPCENEEESKQVAFFFEQLFVKAIIEVINGEDEIWMVETGIDNRLHIWRVNN